MQQDEKTTPRNLEETVEVKKKHGIYEGYEYVVYEFERGFMRILNGYVKIPDNHPQLVKLKKLTWFQIAKGCPRHYHYSYDDVDLDVHGGLTFGNRVTKNNVKKWKQPFTVGWWVGWDYVHAGDEMYISKERMAEKPEALQDAYAGIMAIHTRFSGLPQDRVWKFEESEEECKNAIRQLKKLENNEKN